MPKVVLSTVMGNPGDVFRESVFRIPPCVATVLSAQEVEGFHLTSGCSFISRSEQTIVVESSGSNSLLCSALL